MHRIAAFLEHAARQMERIGAAYGHPHLSDWDRAFEEAPQLIACGPVAQAGASTPPAATTNANSAA